LAVLHGRHAVARGVGARVALGVGHVVVRHPVADAGVDVAAGGRPVAILSARLVLLLAHGAAI
jgi:hypothetical protein